MRMRGPSVEMQHQMEVLYNENEHLTREIAILRDTIKVRKLILQPFCIQYCIPLSPSWDEKFSNKE